MTEYSEEDAQRIADRGRDALLERLRPAFHETARRHADILKLDDAQIEEMIQRAADRADGLQWRRALAAIATEELGMSLGEALTAPVVARAQELAGAPSYEEALAALGLEPARTAAGQRRCPGERAPGRAAEPEAEPVAEAEPARRPSREPEADREPRQRTSPRSRRPRPTRRRRARAPRTDDHEEDRGRRVEPRRSAGRRSRPSPRRCASTATHLGGIATLEAGEQNLELRIGGHGLDIARKPGRVLGRLRWREIRTLEVQPPRGLRRRRRSDRAHLADPHPAR